MFYAPVSGEQKKNIKCEAESKLWFVIATHPTPKKERFYQLEESTADGVGLSGKSFVAPGAHSTKVNAPP